MRQRWGRVKAGRYVADLAQGLGATLGAAQTNDHIDAGDLGVLGGAGQICDLHALGRGIGELACVFQEEMGVL